MENSLVYERPLPAWGGARNVGGKVNGYLYIKLASIRVFDANQFRPKKKKQDLFQRTDQHK